MFHYHVINGLCGCIPDNNSIYGNKKDAVGGLSEVIKLLKQDGDKYDGTLKGGYYQQKDGNYYCELVACSEPECDKEW